MKSGKTVLEIETGLRDEQAMICVTMNSTLLAMQGMRKDQSKKGAETYYCARPASCDRPTAINDQLRIILSYSQSSKR
jgi:hypothetical protein